MGKIIDLVGQKFGRLIVIKFDAIKKGRAHWLCICECGNEKIVASGDLRSGHTKSCGCFRKELSIERLTTHGMCSTRIHQIWENIRRRCNDANNQDYKSYGDRGITYCEEWNSFEVFYKDMKEGYSDNLTIDRINNDGDYCKENCRWATATEQANNRRTNKLLQYESKIFTLANLARHLGIKPLTLTGRIDRCSKLAGGNAKLL